MSREQAVLRDARAIVQRGWNQHALTDGKGAYCLKGAIGIASGAMVDRGGEVAYTKSVTNACLYQFVMGVVASQLPEPFESIPAFNDQPDTTIGDVVAVLDRALDTVESIGAVTL